MKAQLLQQANEVIRGTVCDRSVCLIAPLFNHFFLPVIEQLRNAGADVRAVISAYCDPETVAESRVLSFDMSVRNIPVPQSRFEFALATPPALLCDWLDHIDPSGEIELLGSDFTDVPTVCGRRVLAWRRAEWAEWEDKTRIGAKLKRLGIPTPREVVLASSDPRFVATCKDLDAGRGVVIALDGAHGDRGGGSALRIVRDRAGLPLLQPALSERAKCVRVCEFVTGTPCSVIGMVIDGETIVFDPIEIVTLLDMANGSFVFCGSSTLWEPPAFITAEMRLIARLVGDEMARQSGFRGGFSVDGVLTEAGFLATEVNARSASGLGLRRAWPEFPTYLFGRCILEWSAELTRFDEVAFATAARELIAQHPSFSVLTPKGDGAPTSGVIEIDQGAVASLQITYTASPRGTRARILSVERLRAPKLIGPAAASLATALGASSIASLATS